MDIQLPQILFQIINFSVVVGALTYLLFKPVQKIMDERATKIAEGQKAAEAAMQEKQSVDELKKRSLREAEKEAAAILEEAKKDAQVRTAEVMKQTEEHAKAQLLKYQTEWQSEKKELVKQLKSQFAEAVVATAEKVVGESLSAKSHTKLIDDEMETILKSL